MTAPEIWLRGGMIVDGTGSAPFLADVALLGDKISRVTPPGVIRAQPDQEVNCAGLTVVPGFIDMHTHSDLSFLLDPSADSKVMQGVTTEVVGNCGFSAFPVNMNRQTVLAEFLCGLGVPLVDISWQDFDGYAAAIEACQPVMNVAPLVGHGALRIAVGGTEDIAVDSAVLGQMKTILRDSLEQGAFGLSTGLTYIPSRFAAPPEIHALAEIVKGHDGLYATHVRATIDTFDTIEETIDVGRASGVRVQYSHVAINDPRMWGRAEDVLERFQRAVDLGIDIRYDVYPYDASASSLTQYLPTWLQTGGEDGLRHLLSNKQSFRAARREYANGLFGNVPWNWDLVMVSLAGAGAEDLEGKTIADAATLRNTTPEDLCLQLCADYGNQVQVVLFYRSEEDVNAFVRHPLAIIGSDGNAMPITAPGRPHPRSFGAHARLMQRYVVERNHLSLADAVHKATLAAAHRLGVRDRGTIAAGASADIVALDLPSVRETATWTEPCRLATGVQEVWVNGVLTVSGGTQTGRRAGRVLRHLS